MKLKTVLGLMSLFWLTAMACNLAPSLPENVAATAEVAAKQAQEAAATAAVVAATVAAQGQDLAATVQASDFDFSELQGLQDRFATVLPDENGNINITTFNQISDDSDGKFKVLEIRFCFQNSVYLLPFFSCLVSSTPSSRTCATRSRRADLDSIRLPLTVRFGGPFFLFFAPMCR